MSHEAPLTEVAPEAARAAGECMTAAREEVGISQESISTSCDAESAFTATTLKGTAGTGGRRSLPLSGGCSCCQDAASSNNPPPKAFLFFLVVIR